MLPTPVPHPGHLLSVTAVPGERPGRVVVEVTGEVDGYTAPLLQLCLDSQAARPSLRELVVDLAQVTFLGAAGVTVLVQAHRRCRTRDARLVLRCAGRRRVLRPLQLTGLAGLVVIDRDDSRPLSREGRTAVRPHPTPRRPAGERRRRISR
ncbi:STAS domain-containing protein [Geodermatophilus sp. URMC 60]